MLRCSIIIPCFERESELRKVLHSLKDQDGISECEVLISDDGSSTPLATLLSDVTLPCPIRFVRGENAGPGVARQRAAEVATGTVLAFLDSDCVATSGWLTAVTEGVERTAACVFGPVRSEFPTFPPFLHGWDTGPELFGTANFAISAKQFFAVGGFTSAVSHIAEDWDFNGRLKKAQVAVIYQEEQLVLHPVAVVNLPTLAGLWLRAARDSKQLKCYLSRNSQDWPQWARANREMLKRVVGCVAIVVAPLAVAPIAPVFWLMFLAATVTLGFYKRRQANQALERNRLALRVPARTALRYGLQRPLTEIVVYAQRALNGVGGIDVARPPRAS